MTLSEKVYACLKEIGEEAKIVLQLVMEGEEGINIKVGKNTLIDSNLYRDIKVDVKDEELFNIIVNDYVQYVERGRPAGITPPPYRVILEWAERKGLPTDNNFIYGAIKSIVKFGIRPRPVMQIWHQEIDSFVDEWIDRLAEVMTSEIDNALTL